MVARTSLFISSIALLSSFVNAYGQVAQIVDANNFCVFLPPADSTDRLISDTEWEGQAFCLGKAPKATNAGKLKTGFIQSAHYVKTDEYVQITGQIDPTKENLDPTDDGGQFDVKAPKGASCAGWKYFVNLIEPSGNTYCIRCCNDATNCNRGISQKGCAHIIPGDYSGPFAGVASTAAPTSTSIAASASDAASSTKKTSSAKKASSTEKASSTKKATSTDAAKATPKASSSKGSKTTTAAAADPTTGGDVSSSADATAPSDSSSSAPNDSSSSADTSGAASAASPSDNASPSDDSTAAAPTDDNSGSDPALVPSSSASSSSSAAANAAAEIASPPSSPAASSSASNGNGVISEQSIQQQEESGAESLRPVILTLAITAVSMALIH